MSSEDEIARCLTAALLLELATSPKPGLVDRFSNTETYPCFSVSTTVLYKHFRNAAAGQSIGDAVLQASIDMLGWQTSGNTHLGSLLLLMPVAKAAAAARNFPRMKQMLKNVLIKMNYQDLLKILEAIRVVNPGGLGRVAFLDVNSKKSRETIVRRKISVLEGFRPYVEHEVVAHEYCTFYRASYNHGYVFLRKQISQEDWNTAGLNTFLNLLAHRPDSHVARRNGYAAARMLSRLAKKVINAGGVNTKRGRSEFAVLERVVTKAGFKPAATADLLAVSYALLFLSGWRP